MTDRVPSLNFDSAAMAPGAAFASWSALTPSYDASLVEGTTADDFIMKASAWLLGAVTVTAGQLSPIKLTRTFEHVGKDKRDNYNFLLLTRGEWHGEFGNDGLDVGSGQICAIDFSRTWSAECSLNDHVMIVVPRQTIAALCPDAPMLHGRLFSSASGRMLAEHFLSLARYLPSLDARDAPMVEKATLNLLATAINSLPPEGEGAEDSALGSSATVTNVRQFIDRNLTNPDLTVAYICKELGISRPAIYRSFGVAGGIAGYIQRRRLESAHMMIADAGDGRTIAEIADLFCFASQAHFSTAFRRCFGYPPREARGDIAVAEQATNAQFHHWTQWLARNAP